MRHFLRSHQPTEEAGITELLLGHHSFCYGAPNGSAQVLLLLFKRMDDFTVYPKESLSNLPAEIIDDDIENHQTITLQTST